MATPGYDPDWKKKLEEKRAARAERIKAANPLPAKKDLPLRFNKTAIVPNGIEEEPTSFEVERLDSGSVLKYHFAIPEGFQIWEENEVVGIQHRKDEALSFCCNRQHRLDMKREPNNKFDSNAIAVIGMSKGFFLKHKRHVGYIPADLAAEIVKEKIFCQSKIRLKRIYLSKKDFIDIQYDILVPKEFIKEYRNK